MEENKENMFLGANALIFQRAEDLRARMTQAEKELWEVLKNKKLGGYKFRRQHPILKFILDFYCHETKLGIELDGKIHELSGQELYDKERTEVLNEFGITMLRFQNDDIFNDIERVKLDILKELEK